MVAMMVTLRQSDNTSKNVRLEFLNVFKLSMNAFIFLRLFQKGKWRHIFLVNAKIGIAKCHKEIT